MAPRNKVPWQMLHAGLQVGDSTRRSSDATLASRTVCATAGYSFQSVQDAVSKFPLCVVETLWPFRSVYAPSPLQWQQSPMVLDAVKTHTGAQAAQVLPDAGYRSEAVMTELAQTQPDAELVIALGRERKVQARRRDAQRYPHTVAMTAKFQTEQGRAAYRKRKWIAKPPNGWIKNVLGFRQFSMRGLHKAQTEFKLVCLALNLRRMGAMQAS